VVDLALLDLTESGLSVGLSKRDEAAGWIVVGIGHPESELPTVG
jgi:hypothetical protein